MRSRSRRARRGCGASWCARASTRVWRAGNASLRRWWANRKVWRRRRACVLVVALRKYRGVAVVRPVSADSVPYVDLHLQTSPWARVGCAGRASGSRVARPTSKSRSKRSRREGHHLATRFSPAPGTFQPRSAHREDRRRTPEKARARGDARASRKPASSALLKTGKPGPTIALARRHGCAAGHRAHRRAVQVDRRNLTTAAKRSASCTPAATIRTPPCSWESPRC